MITGYLNQTATWKRVIGQNMYGEPETEEKEIKVRWEGKRRLVRDKEGNEVISDARVFCMENIKTSDRLEYGGRKWPVIAVSIIPGLNGEENHREVAL